jgi:Putative Actinobacterial Holin-X, holin superfamily III
MTDSTNNPPTPRREVGGEGLSTLLGRVGEDLTSLLEAKLGLLKIEIAEDIRAYARGGAGMGVGSVIVAVGFVLLNVGIGFLVSALFEGTELSQPVKYSLGFIITGALYLLLGGGVIIVYKTRLAGRGIVPERSIAELQKDKQWLKKDL